MLNIDPFSYLGGRKRSSKDTKKAAAILKEFLDKPRVRELAARIHMVDYSGYDRWCDRRRKAR